MRCAGTASCVPACAHQPLALCTAALLFVQTRTARTLDVGVASLRLLVRLLDDRCGDDQEVTSHRKLYERTVRKLRELMQARLGAQIDDARLAVVTDRRGELSTHALALHALSAVAADRIASAWLRERAVSSGLIPAVMSGARRFQRHAPSDGRQAHLLGVCLSVLDSVTFMSDGNRCAVLHDGAVPVCLGALHACVQLASGSGSSAATMVADKAAVVECALSALRLLVNLTNHYQDGCDALGETGAMQMVRLVLDFPTQLGEQHRYDVSILGLGVLVNLVEQSASMRTLLARTRSGDPSEHGQPQCPVASLARLFVAKAATPSGGPRNETEENTLAAYLALFLGCAARGSADADRIVRSIVRARGRRGDGQAS